MDLMVSVEVRREVLEFDLTERESEGRGEAIVDMIPAVSVRVSGALCWMCVGCWDGWMVSV